MFEGPLKDKLQFNRITVIFKRYVYTLNRVRVKDCQMN